MPYSARRGVIRGGGSRSLILRIVRGRLLPGRQADVRAGLATSLSEIQSLGEALQVYAALRSAGEENTFAVISTWPSVEAVVAAFGPDARRIALVPGVTEHLEVDSVTHFELDESMLVQTDRAATVARVAVGAVELGSDVEIQQELRRRLPGLGQEVVEAYVGRRIRDRMVEVAFVTLWSMWPADRPLEAPLFPDVADRYSSYWIEVYDELFRP